MVVKTKPHALSRDDDSDEFSENSCLECLRSTPCASLWGLIFCFLGAGAVGGGIIFGVKMIKDINSDFLHLFPFVDYATYALVGSTALFVIIAYIICSLSSGRNSRTIFDGSKKTKCGRAMNLIILLICFFSILLWVFISLLLWLPVSDILFLYIRKTYHNATDPYDLSYYGLFKADRTAITVTKADFEAKMKDVLICSGVAMGGSLFVIFGMIQIALCTAMNYARFEELRYYSVNREESGSPSGDVQL